MNRKRPEGNMQIDFETNHLFQIKSKQPRYTSTQQNYVHWMLHVFNFTAQPRVTCLKLCV